MTTITAARARERISPEEAERRVVEAINSDPSEDIRFKDADEFFEYVDNIIYEESGRRPPVLVKNGLPIGSMANTRAAH